MRRRMVKSDVEWEVACGYEPTRGLCSAGWRRVSRSDMPVGTCSTLFRLDYAGHTRTRQTFQMSPKRQRAQGTHTDLEVLATLR
eukprot:scaffold79676_cov51-Phaeocystis_antarctica.AAC.1